MPRKIERISDEQLEGTRGGDGEQGKIVMQLLDEHVSQLPGAGSVYDAHISPVGWELVG